MPTCASCGADNPPGFRFCGSCGAALAEPEAAREERKTVTVVFCDVTGSTALGERLDPESLRQVMARYFEAMRTVVERHGGTVEKFIGDAVMAVFGVPRLHEDDALRALRAAEEMRGGLAELNAELERGFGTTLELRTGVNTGEVVTGTAERLVTGDAVNVAARLEQAARPGEILLGAETARLARDAIEVEELPPLELKGKAAGVPAYRLLRVDPAAPGLARNLDVPMVGRERERRLLLDAWERVVSERTCVLFTLLGAAGVGKSRLVADFRGRIDAAVVEGRCLSYGEAITYWPVLEVVKQLPPPGELGLDAAATATLASLLGESDAATSPEQIAWAFRKLLEAAAARRPLLVLFDDIHWGEPAFFDLIRHVSDLSRGAPILLLCGARPELFERAAGWAGGMLNATTVLLEPLTAEETDELIVSLAGRGIDPALRERIRRAADGNPLFVEEMMAMAGDGDGADLAVPPTIQALLSARLDQLDPAERGVLARGAVEGQVFHLGAVRALAPEEPEPAARVTELVRKELVRPEQAALPEEDAYRFRHLLIRDAAYDALPKATRAELHERFADWLDERGGDLVERDEIVGYHLAEAYRYRAELGPLDDHGIELGRRAGKRLAVSGETALSRRDVAAAVTLLGRAVELLSRDDPDRAGVLVHLAEALFDRGETALAVARAEEAVQAARARDDEQGVARARLRQLTIQAMTDPEAGTPAFLAEVETMFPSLERVGDEETLAQAYAFAGRFRFFLGQAESAEREYERAVEHGRRARRFVGEEETLSWWLGAKRYGTAPVDEALAFADALGEPPIKSPALDAYRLSFAGSLLAMQGRFAEARESTEQGDRQALELGLEIRRWGTEMESGYVELLAGDVEAAIRRYRDGYENLARLGETGFRATIGTLLAEALATVRRDEEAEDVLREVDEIVQQDDFDPQARMRWVRARILARRGDLAEAERLAREAVGLMAPTDYLDLTGHAHVALAEVLEACGRIDDAVQELRRAADLFSRKGNIVLADRTREQLETIRADAPA